MQRLESVSDAQVAEADIIATYAPETMDGHQLWGQEAIGHGRAPGAAAYREKTLKIELPTGDRSGLVALINRIEKIRGRLPQDVERLRTQIETERVLSAIVREVGAGVGVD